MIIPDTTDTAREEFRSGHQKVCSGSIESMEEEEVRGLVASLSLLAKNEKNLDIIFGSNGSTGRGATGNFTLIARVTGIHRVHIGRILTGRCSPSLRAIRLISDKTGIGVGEIEKYIREKGREGGDE